MTQSNEPSIDQMNEAIAILDGWVKKNKREFVKEGQMMYIWEFKYHVSWDYLMPVYHSLREKAFELCNESETQRLFACISNQLLFGTIADVHLKTYDLITWLNQQTTTNEQDKNKA